MPKNRGGRARSARRGGWGPERLEDRTLLNASIEVRPDGWVVYHADPTAAERLTVAVAPGSPDRYVFAADEGSSPIDVAANPAGLPTTGSGTRTVTVEGVTRLWIETTRDDQVVRVRATNVFTEVVLRGDRGAVALGNEGTSDAPGLGALTGPVVVSAVEGAEGNALIVADGGGAAGGTGDPPLSYAIAADSVVGDAAGPGAFGGVRYSGVSALVVRGARSSPGSPASYAVLGTADGVATTIEDVGAGRPSVAILGTSADPDALLTIRSQAWAFVSAESTASRVMFDGPGGGVVQIQRPRGGGQGLHGDFVVLSPSGRATVLVGDFWGPVVSPDGYWNEAAAPDVANWFLAYDPAGAAEYAALRDAAAPGSGVFFKPSGVHALQVDARTNAGASIMVDFRNGDPLPSSRVGSDEPLLRSGLTYLGAAAPHSGSPYALALVGAPPTADGGRFAAVSHDATAPYYGILVLQYRDSGADDMLHRAVTYLLDDGAAVIDDATPAGDFEWRHGPTPPASIDVAIEAGGPSIAGPAVLRIRDRSPGALLAEMLLSGKARAALYRDASGSPATTTLDYRDDRPVGGLVELKVQTAWVAQSTDAFRLLALPPGATTSVVEYGGAVSGGPGGYDDEVLVSLAGAAKAGATFLSDDAGENTLTILNDDGRNLGPADVVPLADGWSMIPAASPTGGAISFKGYARVEFAGPTGTRHDEE